MSLATSRSISLTTTSGERKEPKKGPLIYFSEIMQSELNSIPGIEWIDKLKYAFNEADSHGNNKVTLSQWMNSRLRYVISDRILTDEEMNDFFEKVDTDLDGSIQFEELENYLISHQGTITQLDMHQVLHLSYFKPFDETMIFTKRTEHCLKSLFIPRTIQILSITESIFTIWDPGSLTPIRQIDSCKGKFVDFCYIPSLFLVVIALQNRKLFFFDLRSLKKLKFYISASLDSQKVLKMSLAESYKALQHVEKNKVPLFNAPTSIASDPNESLVFIGDDSGRIEVFDIHRSRHSKLNYGFTRLGIRKFHQTTVSQIMYLDDFGSFVSSSFDGSFQMWTFDSKSKLFTTQYTYNDPLQCNITGFVYDLRTKSIIYRTTNHCICSWKVKTKHRRSVSTSDNIEALSVYLTDENTSYVVAVSSNRFFSSYQLPSFDQKKNWFMGSHHDISAPYSCLIIKDHFYLIGTYISVWDIEICDEEFVNPHSGIFVAALVNDATQRILTIDRKGNQVQWDSKTGIKQFKSTYVVNEKVTINCACMDKQKRRLGVGFSTGAFQIISINSGTILFDMDSSYCVDGCLNIEFGILFGQPRILCCAGNNSAVIFDDINSSRIRFDRNFVGHTENIMKTVILKEKLILTIGIGHECFLWSISRQAPIAKIDLKGDPTTACDLPDDPDIFIVGDVIGFIYFVSIETKSIITSMNPFGMKKDVSITFLSVIEELGYLIACNYNGYVKLWSMNQIKESGGNSEDEHKSESEDKNDNESLNKDENKIEDLGNKLKNFDEDFVRRMNLIRLFRAHTQSIFSVDYSKVMNSIITLGRDQEVRIWSLDPFSLIGELGKPKKWNFDKRETWIGDDNVFFNENDFATSNQQNLSLNKKQPKYIQDSIQEGPKIENVPKIPFSVSTFENMMENVEKQIKSGRILIKKMPKKSNEPIHPPSSRPCSNPRNLRFDALISSKDLYKARNDMVNVYIKGAKNPIEERRRLRKKYNI